MGAPFLMPNDVKLGKDTPKGFTLEVNGYDPIECVFDMKFEKEPVRRGGKFTGKYKTVCYPNYYIIVQWDRMKRFFRAESLDEAKEHIALQLNSEFNSSYKRD